MLRTERQDQILEILRKDLRIRGSRLSELLGVSDMTIRRDLGILEKSTVVLVTVKNDMHYIGKNIVKLLLETSGFNVHDLDVDVDPFAIIVKADEVNADIIALSALLTTTLVGQKDVIKALKRDKYKVILGDGAVTKSWIAAYMLSVVPGGGTFSPGILPNWLNRTR